MADSLLKLQSPPTTTVWNQTRFYIKWGQKKYFKKLREQRAKYRGVRQTKDYLISWFDKAISDSFRENELNRIASHICKTLIMQIALIVWSIEK